MLRWLTGANAGMPHFQPLTTQLPDAGEEREQRIFRLRDEFEWLVLPSYRNGRPPVGRRPVRETLNHEHVRALLDWKSSHLDLWLSAAPHMIGGRIFHEITPEARKEMNERAARAGKKNSRPREFVNEVKFDTTRFMAWYYAYLN